MGTSGDHFPGPRKSAAGQAVPPPRPSRPDLLRSLRPRRHDAVHPRIRDRLPHVLVVVQQNPEEHTLRDGLLPEELHLLLTVRAFIPLADRVARSFPPVAYVPLRRHAPLR